MNKSPSIANAALKTQQEPNSSTRYDNKYALDEYQAKNLARVKTASYNNIRPHLYSYKSNESTASLSISWENINAYYKDKRSIFNIFKRKNTEEADSSSLNSYFPFSGKFKPKKTNNYDVTAPYSIDSLVNANGSGKLPSIENQSIESSLSSSLANSIMKYRNNQILSKGFFLLIFN
jgi:hypothetical protein